jgi:Zn-finger nucleic acid-binding protein
VTQEAGGFLAPLLANLTEQLTKNVRFGLCAQGLHTLAPGQERCEVCPAPSLRCPACVSRLLPLKTHGQIVDVCTHCPGLWLDANELAALRRAQRSPPSARPRVQSIPSERSTTSPTPVGNVAGSIVAEGALALLLEAIFGLF